MNMCALGSAANDGAWQPAVATGLPGGDACAAAARSCKQTFDKTLDAPMSTVLSEFPTVRADDAAVSNDCEYVGFGPTAENIVGPWPASRVLVSNVLFQIA